MFSHLRCVSATALAVAALCPSVARAQQTVYAIAGGGSTLIRFQSNNPSSITVVGNFGGDATFLDALDFRPATGELYGYLDSTDSFYRINLATGLLSQATVGASGAPTNTFQLGLDFNPVIDRARIVTDSAQNIVFNPLTGTAASFTNLAYAVGDANANASPSIIDNAYSQNFAGSLATTQYAIDYGTGSLVTLANNAGTLTTVGSLGVSTGIYTGFDIFTGPGNVDIGYAILTAAGGRPSFYNINLVTGQATLVGVVGTVGGVVDNQIYSLAVIPSPATVLAFACWTAAAGLRRRRCAN